MNQRNRRSLMAVLILLALVSWAIRGNALEPMVPSPVPDIKNEQKDIRIGDQAVSCWTTCVVYQDGTEYCTTECN